MTHPQTTPRGSVAHQQVEIGAADLTADSTGNVIVNQGVKLGDSAATLGTDSTGNVTLTAGITIGALSTISVDSTGNLMFGESYLAMTSVAPA